MDANSFVILAAVVTLFSFNLTASLMCCRSLGKRVDRLEVRMDRMEQALLQLTVDMALMKADMGLMKADMALMKADMGLVKGKLGIETAPQSAAPQPAIAPDSGASSGASAQ